MNTKNQMELVNNSINCIEAAVSESHDAYDRITDLENESIPYLSEVRDTVEVLRDAAESIQGYLADAVDSLQNAEYDCPDLEVHKEAWEAAYYASERLETAIGEYQDMLNEWTTARDRITDLVGLPIEGQRWLATYRPLLQDLKEQVAIEEAKAAKENKAALVDLEGVTHLGYVVMRQRPYNPTCATDNHLSVVLCRRLKGDDEWAAGRPEYVVWTASTEREEPSFFAGVRTDNKDEAIRFFDLVGPANHTL